MSSQTSRPIGGFSLITMFGAGFVIASVLAFVVGWLVWSRPGARLDLSQPTVVMKIQQLQRLQTVVYTLEKIVSGSQDTPYLPRVLAGDRILLIVHGEVTAGIDLAALDPSHLTVSGESIELNLPEPDVFSTRIDNEKTRVYSRETGLLVRPDPDLESVARREAERQIRQAAIDGGILTAANANARATLTTLLQGLGFKSVQFRDE
ncbi:MAG: DUF4230 domain-containing protein [Cyanobacteria bacterium]|nr:DUF4230 domain-containing protein [Cyanobacteriota bacterium]